jgi:hypothetical protein
MQECAAMEEIQGLSFDEILHDVAQNDLRDNSRALQGVSGTGPDATRAADDGHLHGLSLPIPFQAMHGS